MRTQGSPTEQTVGIIILIILAGLLIYANIDYAKKTAEISDRLKRETGGMMGAILVAQTLCKAWEACSYYDPVALTPGATVNLAVITDNIPCSGEYPGGCEHICTCLTRLKGVCNIGSGTGNAALCAASNCRIEIT